MNNILISDSYKYSHFMQYPEGTEYVNSYIEARGTHNPDVQEVVLFGLQAFINDILRKPITIDDVQEAKRIITAHGMPFNEDGWMRIVDVHNGYFPVMIESVPEGTPVPLKNVMVQIRNTDPALAWVTSFLETLLLSYIWYGSTVATNSREIKKLIKFYLDATSDNADAELPFKLHDFGYRGVAAGAAGLGAAAHLVNFMGTDTIAGLIFAAEHYSAEMAGYSISASEHSTMTSWGRDGEFDAYRNMVDQYAKPGATFACVIDSYDTFGAIDMFCDDRCVGGSLLDIVKNRGATIVLRPDSGDPIQMPVDVIRYLMDKVGYTVNSKGFKVLPDHIRVIQGDGIDGNDVFVILDELMSFGISASNIAFGMGGGLLQKVNRDTYKFAMKASSITINGQERDVVKDPITDPGKKSKAGILALVERDGKVKTIRASDRRVGDKDLMFPVYGYNGNVGMFFKEVTFDEVRQNAEV